MCACCALSWNKPLPQYFIQETHDFVSRNEKHDFVSRNQLFIAANSFSLFLWWQSNLGSRVHHRWVVVHSCGSSFRALPRTVPQCCMWQAQQVHISWQSVCRHYCEHVQQQRILATSRAAGFQAKPTTTTQSIAKWHCIGIVNYLIA